MSILNPKSKKEQCKFIGAFLPQWIHSYLAMYTLAKEQTKSEVIRNLIEDWVKSSEISDNELLQEIISKVKTQWKLQKHSDSSLNFDYFKRNIHQELTRKGMQEDYIELILKEIE